MLTCIQASYNKPCITVMPALQWNERLGPDIRLEHGLFVHKLATLLKNMDMSSHLSLFELLCSPGFNGFGELTASEILQRLAQYFGNSILLCLAINLPIQQEFLLG